MAKQLTTKWQEAVGMLAHCGVEAAMVVGRDTLQIVLRDPAGQRFGFQARAVGVPGFAGNVLTVNMGLQMDALELAPGEFCAGVQF